MIIRQGINYGLHLAAGVAMGVLVVMAAVGARKMVEQAKDEDFPPADAPGAPPPMAPEDPQPLS